MPEWIVKANSLGDLVKGLWTGGKRLVRCKDCAYAEDPNDGYVYCPTNERCFKFDDFCSYGVRKDEVEE